MSQQYIGEIVDGPMAGQRYACYTKQFEVFVERQTPILRKPGQPVDCNQYVDGYRLTYEWEVRAGGDWGDFYYVWVLDEPSSRLWDANINGPFDDD